MAIKVYRVEHRNGGFGPYVVGGLQSETGYVWHSAEKGRPSPWVDNIKSGEFTEHHICGFVTKRQLRRWFLRFRNWLTEKGYVVAVYTVQPENVVVGKRQCVFIPSTEKTVYTIQEML